MKTLEEIIKEVQELELGNDELLLFNESDVKEIAKRYARAALEKAAKTARIRKRTETGGYTAGMITDPNGHTYEVDKSSITDIELL
jgi:hypothetical protein